MNIWKRRETKLTGMLWLAVQMQKSHGWLYMLLHDSEHEYRSRAGEERGGGLTDTQWGTTPTTLSSVSNVEDLASNQERKTRLKSLRSRGKVNNMASSIPLVEAASYAVFP